jgi:hypothetical protein
MNSEKFYTPEQIRPQYDDIVPAYQDAFEGEPWYEVSKCEDTLKRCIGSLSALAVGKTCLVCNEQTKRPAYESDELIERFENLGYTRPTDWYIERTMAGLAFAAVAWNAKAEQIADERYADVPVMKDWIKEQLEDRETVWLDEVFANKKVRLSGNLNNFEVMCETFKDRLGNDTLAFRTINPRLVAAAERDYGERAKVFKRQGSTEQGPTAPDRREFVIIKPRQGE